MGRIQCWRAVAVSLRATTRSSKRRLNQHPWLERPLCRWIQTALPLRPTLLCTDKMQSLQMEDKHKRRLYVQHLLLDIRRSSMRMTLLRLAEGMPLLMLIALGPAQEFGARPLRIQCWRAVAVSLRATTRSSKHRLNQHPWLERPLCRWIQTALPLRPTLPCTDKMQSLQMEE